MLHTLPILADRAQAALVRRGIAAKRSDVIAAVAASLGFRSANEATAASKAGTLDIGCAVELEPRYASALVALRDPANGRNFGIEASLLPNGKERAYDAITVTPYGNLVKLPIRAGSDHPAPVALVVRATIEVMLAGGTDEPSEDDDSGVAGTYEYTFPITEISTDVEQDLDPIEEHVLDLFHNENGISNLEDFEISVSYSTTRGTNVTSRFATGGRPAQNDPDTKTARTDRPAGAKQVTAYQAIKYDYHIADDAEVPHIALFETGEDGTEARRVIDVVLDDRYWTLDSCKTFLGFQVCDAHGQNIQGNEEDPTGYASFEIMSPEVAAAEADKFDQRLKLGLQAIYEGEIERCTVIEPVHCYEAAGLTNASPPAARHADKPAASKDQVRTMATKGTSVRYAYATTPKDSLLICEASEEAYRRRLADWCLANVGCMDNDEQPKQDWDPERVITTFFDDPNVTRHCFVEDGTLRLDVPTAGARSRASLTRLAKAMESLSEIATQSGGMRLAKQIGDVLGGIDPREAAETLRKVLAGPDAGPSRQDGQTTLEVWDNRIDTDKDEQVRPENRPPWEVTATQVGENVRIEVVDPHRRASDQGNRSTIVLVEIRDGTPRLYVANGAEAEQAPVVLHMQETGLLMEGHSDHAIRVDRDNRFHRISLREFRDATDEYKTA